MKKKYDITVPNGKFSVGRHIDLDGQKAVTISILSTQAIPEGLRIKGWCKPIKERIKKVIKE